MARAINLILAGLLAYPTVILAHGGRYDVAALIGAIAVANLCAAILGGRS